MTQHRTATATAPETADLDRLRARLADAAAADGLLDLAYRTVDSPVGPLLVAATPVGVVRVAFSREGHDDVLAALAGSISPRVLHAPARLDAVARELEEYFDGRREHFDLALDLRLAQGFRRRVVEELRAIPYGGRQSYADVATRAGSPRAVRAVGTACATNPVPVLVPCHRVVRSDGATGSYRGGADAKRWLLALETGTSLRAPAPSTH